MNVPTENLCNKLREVVNSTNIFYEDEVEKKNYNYICAMMDRVDDSMGHLLACTDLPETSDELLLILIHACIVVDAIKRLFEKLGLNYNLVEHGLPRYLGSICKAPPFEFSDEHIPSDDDIFKYIRSISFAHPLDTSWGRLMNRIKDCHCSPFVVVHKGFCKEGCVGVHVYSGNTSASFTINIPYADLMAYVFERYELIQYLADELERRIRNKEDMWRRRTVKRELGDPVLVLDDILSIMTERYQSTYDVAMLKSLLTYPYTNRNNDKAVAKVQQVALSIISDICDAIDEMDGEKLYDALDKVLYVRPKKMHQMTYYQLEKIFSYLNDRASPSDKRWGLMQADEFAKEFAKNWVEIDVRTMECEEIKLLTIVACFLEVQKQEQNS